MLCVLLILMLSASAVGHTPGHIADGVRSASIVQAMIDAADPGDTVIVPAGVYEGSIIIRLPMTIDGMGAAIFDGLGRGTVIDVLAERVTIRGCRIRASGADVTGEPAAIRVQAPHAVIERNIIEDALFGIDLREAPGSIVRSNIITGKDLEPGRRGDGIRLWWSHDSVVEDNVVSRTRDLVFWYSENLRIARNKVVQSRYGLHFMYSHNTRLLENNLSGNSVGVYLMYSNHIELVGNRMHNNRGASGYGVGLKDCDDITIRGNAMLANRVGAYVDNSPSSVGSVGLFSRNLIAFNEIGLLATPNTHDNVFSGNAFVDNEESASTHGRGRLVSNAFSQDGVGNFWAEYSGFDLDGDFIGDLPHEPRSLFGSLLAGNPNLRLFAHSPVERAIEFTARVLPDMRPDPTLIDPTPLVRPPPMPFSLSSTSGSGVPMGAVATGLLAAASVMMAVLGRAEMIVAPCPDEGAA